MRRYPVHVIGNNPDFLRACDFFVNRNTSFLYIDIAGNIVVWYVNSMHRKDDKCYCEACCYLHKNHGEFSDDSDESESLGKTFSDQMRC
jgi:hypothetical protein